MASHCTAERVCWLHSVDDMSKCLVALLHAGSIAVQWGSLPLQFDCRPCTLAGM